MDEFKRILAEEISEYFKGAEAEEVSAEEILEQFEDELPELEAFYNAAKRWCKLKQEG